MSGSDQSRMRRALSRMTGATQEQRLDALERALRKVGEAQRDQGAALSAAIADLADRVGHQPTAKDLQQVLQAVRALDSQIDRSIEDGLAHGGPLERQRLAEKRLRKRLDQIAAGDGPIIVGPWSGEVGFEVLYWVPFVEWVRSQWGIAPERQIVVSRGGVASWYEAAGSRCTYADTFSFFSVDAFREAAEQERRKQRRIAALDRRIVDVITERHALKGVELLHPGLMYRMFMPYWRDEASVARVDRFTLYRPLQAPDDAVPAGLPAEYVAVRFYFSQCFPDTPDNRAFVRAVVSSIAARMPVVLLNPGLSVDDHADFVPSARDRVHTIDKGLAPDRNLAVQSAVIAGAKAFVGTYGGYSYLSPFYGVPAIGFYSARTFKEHHLHVAQRVFERLGRATVMPIDVAHAPVVQLALAGLVGAES